MAVSAYASGTQVAVINTEHTLASVNVAGVCQCEVDLNAMVAGDVVELRAYAITLTGGSARLAAVMRYYGAQDEPSVTSLPFSNELTDADSLKFTLKQTFGTGRSFPYKVLKHG